MRRLSFILISLALAVSSAFIAPKAMADTTVAPTVAPAAPMKGEAFVLSGNIGTPVARAVTLERWYSSGWQAHQTGTTTADGKYSFTAATTAAVRPFRVVAPAVGAYPQVTSATLEVKTVEQRARLYMERVMGTSTASIKGTFYPVRAGRKVALQTYTGGSWVQIGAKLSEDASGKVAIKLSFTALKLGGQYSYHRFRLVGDAWNGSDKVYSPEIRFMPGPTKFGPHVIRIRTNGGTYPSTKGPEYTGTASIDGAAAVKLEYVGVRGNSTSKLAKKPYKIKFDSKQTPFGMPKAKRFDLLAMFIDNAKVRDRVGLKLGEDLSPAKGGHLAWTPRTEYTEVFMNDLYVGVYLFTEAVGIDGDRVDVDDEKGMVVQVDGNTVDSGKFGFKTSHGVTVVFEDPDERKKLDDGSVDPEGFTDAKLNAMKAKVVALEKELYTGQTKSDYLTRVGKHLDLNAAMDYYLVKEFTKDNDADFYRSHYFYLNDYTDPTSKLTFGPVWDFDRSAGVITDTGSTPQAISSPSGWYMRASTPGLPSHLTHYSHWFVQLTKSSAFRSNLKDRWNTVKSKFLKVSKSDGHAQVAANIMIVSAANDRARWASTSKRYSARASTFQGEINWVRGWYAKRYAWMDGQFN